MPMFYSNDPTSEHILWFENARLKPHLLQLMMTSSGWILFFSIPCLGWSPLPRKSPGGSILKFPMRSRWWSNTQYPYSSTIFWLASLLTWRTFIVSEEHQRNNSKNDTVFKTFRCYERHLPTSPLCSSSSWLPPSVYEKHGAPQNHTCSDPLLAVFPPKSSPVQKSMHKPSKPRLCK